MIIFLVIKKNIILKFTFIINERIFDYTYKWGYNSVLDLMLLVLFCVYKGYSSKNDGYIIHLCYPLNLNLLL